MQMRLIGMWPRKPGGGNLNKLEIHKSTSVLMFLLVLTMARNMYYNQ